jgi:hypothetical protein
MSDFDPRFDPAFQRGYDGPAVASKKQTTEPAPESIPLIQVDADVSRDEPIERRTNPFLIALTIASIAFVAAGLVLVFQLRALFADTQASADFDYITLQTLMIGAPILVGLGLATGIGVLFVYAVRWGR